METITKDDGTEITVLSAEEIQAKIDAEKEAAIEAYKAENPDKSEELAKLQDELTKLKDKDLNFGNLRTQKEAAEKKVEEILKGVPTQIETAKKEILETVMKDHYNDTLKSLAGEDEEVKKKIEFQFKRLADTAGTKEEITKKLTDAYLLATGKPDEGLNSTVLSSGGVRPLNIKSQSTVALKPNEKAIANQLGITDDDLKKYGGQV